MGLRPDLRLRKNQRRLSFLTDPEQAREKSIRGEKIMVNQMYLDKANVLIEHFLIFSGSTAKSLSSNTAEAQWWMKS